MLLIMMAVAFLAVGAVVNVYRTRRDCGPLARHERALDALRDIAEHPHPMEWEVAPAEPVSIEHVHILEDAPVHSVVRARPPRPRKRATAARATRRRPNAAQVASRPTIALLPARVHLLRAVPAPAEIESATESEPDLQAAPVPETSSPPVDASTRRAAVVVVAASVLIVALAVTGLSVGGGHARPKRSAVVARAPRSDPARARTTTPRTQALAPTQVQLVATSPNEGTIKLSAPFILTLAAKGDCWVRIQTDTGRTLFERTLHAGQQQQLTGAAALVVRLGNTPAIGVIVNGAPLDLSRVAQTADVRFVTS
jgi:cytoskeletal protein RodZ